MSLQRRTLELFTALSLLESSWTGTLLLGIGLDGTARALALASLAAGAAALFLEQDAEHLRAAQRDGCCDFSVTTLDEALRILKNEIRRGGAISVGLRGEPAASLREMVERGLQPDYVASCRAVDETILATLRVRGARTLHGRGLNAMPGSLDLPAFSERAGSERWHLVETTAPTVAALRADDASMLRRLHGDDPMSALARQWLQVAPTLFPRVLGRAAWTKNPRT